MINLDQQIPQLVGMHQLGLKCTSWPGHVLCCKPFGAVSAHLYFPPIPHSDRSCKCLNKHGESYECGLGPKCKLPCGEGQVSCTDDWQAKLCVPGKKCDSNNDCGNYGQWYDEPAGCKYDPTFQLTLGRHNNLSKSSEAR